MKQYHIVIFSHTSLHTSPSVNTTLLALLEISWERKNISWERTTLHKFPEKSPSCFKNLFFSYVSKATTVPRVMITQQSFPFKRSAFLTKGQLRQNSTYQMYCIKIGNSGSVQKMLNGNIFSQREPEKVEGEDARLMYHVVVVGGREGGSR